MKLSVKVDYACRVLAQMAKSYGTAELAHIEQLAEVESVPANYLVQILIELKSKRLVKSVRGKDGGYLLARPPAEITFGDVIRAMHGEVFDSPALSDSKCSPELKAAWETLQTALNQKSDSFTFQQLAEQGAKERMYYI